MTATLLIPFLVAIVGALVYVMSSNAKLQQLGLYAYGAAMIALMIYYTHNAVRIG